MVRCKLVRAAWIGMGSVPQKPAKGSPLGWLMLDGQRPATQRRREQVRQLQIKTVAGPRNHLCRTDPSSDSGPDLFNLGRAGFSANTYGVAICDLNFRTGRVTRRAVRRPVPFLLVASFLPARPFRLFGVFARSGCFAPAGVSDFTLSAISSPNSAATSRSSSTLLATGAPFSRSAWLPARHLRASRFRRHRAARATQGCRRAWRRRHRARRRDACTCRPSRGSCRTS